ncbi:hypothetical protein HMPREF0872_00375 [Veillonella montpellierensis DNF00314]|uniref:Uncharacterized protein n=2 Tax=Veillonella montpellierensis TaxID=187328 RepID=A0A096AMQ6_9FIRM|nr:hypothetical protein HMPREF0872_00375 [Veillonella montpellierensis DNF00314]
MNKEELRKEILQYLYDKGYKYIARDLTLHLYIYKGRPYKEGDVWTSADIAGLSLKAFGDLFENVKFEDEEPLSIAKELGIIDWATIPKDTKVLVSQDGDTWVRRHFAEFNEKGIHKFIVYGYGETSWTASDDYKVTYEYCKLAEEEEEQ